MSISQNENYVRFNGRVYTVDGNNKLALINKNIDKIAELQGLKNLVRLRSLNLSQNNISTIKGLEALQRLEDLDLRSNNIARIGGLSGLSALKRLDLNYNHIKTIRGVDQLNQLEYLGLKGNHIERIEGLENLTHLKELHLEGNPIERIESFDTLPKQCRIFLDFTHLHRTPQNVPLDLARLVSISQTLVHFYVIMTLRLPYDSDNMNLSLYELMKVFPDLVLPNSFETGIELIQKLDALSFTQAQFQNLIKDGKMMFWKTAYIYAKSFFWMRYKDGFVRVPDQISFHKAHKILQNHPDFKVHSEEARPLEEDYLKRIGTEYIKYDTEMKGFYTQRLRQKLYGIIGKAK